MVSEKSILKNTTLLNNQETIVLSPKSEAIVRLSEDVYRTLIEYQSHKIDDDGQALDLFQNINPSQRVGVLCLARDRLSREEKGLIYSLNLYDYYKEFEDSNHCNIYTYLMSKFLEITNSLLGNYYIKDYTDREVIAQEVLLEGVNKIFMEFANRTVNIELGEELKRDRKFIEIIFPLILLYPFRSVRISKKYYQLLN